MQVLEKGEYSGLVTHASGVSGLLATITDYNNLHFNGDAHYHDNAHFSFAIKGGCVEKKKEAYEITPGHIAYYTAGEIHQVLKVPMPTRRVNLEMEPGFFSRFGVSDQEARLAATKNPDAKFLMVKIYHELLANDNFSELSVRMLLLKLIGETKKTAPDQIIPPWVKEVSEFLHEHAEAAITLDELAQISGLHPVTISRLFPQYFSCTVGEYKRKIKIEMALELLKSDKGTLADVAYQCGFFDQSHFIRIFKQMTGCLPGRYRNL